VQGDIVRTTIFIDNEEIEVVDQFTYLRSSVNNKFSLDQEINIRIEKATTMNRLTKRVWDNKKLTIKTKIIVYKACVISTFLYGSETWSTYMYQERRLNSFYVRCLR
jgi:adenylate kinase family enzyme